MLKTIVCATDGSEHANKAVDWASDLAVKYDAELILLYVLPHREAPPELRHMAEVEHLVDTTKPPGAPATEPLYPSGNIGEGLSEHEISSARIYREIGERTLEAGERRARDHGVARVTTLVEDGEPATRILEVAEQRHADLIVMGRRGLSDLKGLLLGSVTHKVAQLAKCPCLTVW